MKLFSQQLELRAVRSMAVSSPGDKVASVTMTDATSISSLLLSSVDESFFHYEPAKAAYKRLMSVAQRRSKIISFEDLIEDPAINEEFRDVLGQYKKAPVISVDRATTLLASLDEYRQTRSLYYMAKNVLETLKKSEVNVGELLDTVTNQLTAARSRDSMTDQIQTIGHDANAVDELLDEALSTEDDQLLLTGIKEFDDRNGGITAEGVWLIAATTSGGKSVARMNLCKNLYLLNNVSVCTVSLEMNSKKETHRLLSNLTRIPFWKFKKKRLSDADRELCRKKWKAFHLHGKKCKARYSILCPTRGVTIQQLLMLVKPYKFKVLAIDYIGLLEGVDGKDQWQVLSSITRICKIFSSENKCLVILLAQLDSDDDRVRYSKGIMEHVDSCWIWNYSKQEQRDLRTIPVVQKKARDQELFPFDLAEQFNIMTISNPDEERAPEEHDDTTADSPTRKHADNPLSDDEPVTYDVG